MERNEPNDLSPSERVHPKWGYDFEKVTSRRCLTCGEAIGGEPYEEETMLARFGQMLFRHARCAG
jgi:hypothetical protein